MTDNKDTGQVGQPGQEVQGEKAPAMQINSEIPTEGIIPPTREDVSNGEGGLEGQNQAIRVQENVVEENVAITAEQPVLTVDLNTEGEVEGNIDKQVAKETTKAQVLSVVNNDTTTEEDSKEIKIYSERDLLKYSKAEVIDVLAKSSDSKLFKLYVSLHHASSPNETVEKMIIIRKAIQDKMAA